MRLIDADALLEKVKKIPTFWSDGGGGYGGTLEYPDGMYYPEDIVSAIENAPNVERSEQNANERL